MAPAAFCGTCGWPVETAGPCEVCGQNTAPVAARDQETNIFVFGEPRPEDFPGMENAFVAWKQRDWNRLVGQCLTAVGVENPQISNLPTGPGWTYMQNSAAIYVTVNRAQNDFSIESPMVRLPVKQRVPMMRALLELNTRALGAARFCLRDGLVVLRFADRMENLSPPKLVAAIREVSTAADRFDDLLAITFAARQIGPDAQKQRLAWTVIGTPRVLGGFDFDQTAPAAAPEPIAIATPTPEPLSSPLSALEAQLGSNDRLCDLMREALTLSKPFPFQKVHRAVPLLLQRAFLYRAYDEHHEGSPDAIAFLMKQGDLLVDRVWESPAPGLLGKVGVALDDEARGWPIPIVFDGTLKTFIQKRAQVDPQAPFIPTQFKGALDTKAHFKKVLAEIDKAPTDAALRHFLLMGALAELLSRTRLAPATTARIRQAMNDARAAATPPSVEALMQLMRAVVA